MHNYYKEVRTYKNTEVWYYMDGVLLETQDQGDYYLYDSDTLPMTDDEIEDWA